MKQKINVKIVKLYLVYLLLYKGGGGLISLEVPGLIFTHLPPPPHTHTEDWAGSGLGQSVHAYFQLQFLPTTQPTSHSCSSTHSDQRCRSQESKHIFHPTGLQISMLVLCWLKKI